MDPNIAAIIGGVAGALIGTPAGYFVERFFNRPQINIGYGETAYEDLVSLSSNIIQKIRRIRGFVEFVESQIRWNFEQRLAGNMFTSEELRVIDDLGVHYREVQSQILEMLKAQITTVEASSYLDPPAVAELSGDYNVAFSSVLAADLESDPIGTVQKLKAFLTNFQESMTVGSR